MIRYHLDARDLARIRFAVSPLWEAVASARQLALRQHDEHRRWAARVGPRLTVLELAPLIALASGPSEVPDFLLPLPDGPVARLDDELEQLRATPADIVREQAGRLHPEPPAALRPLLEDPERELARLAALLQAYFARALEPDWRHMQAVLESDVLYRGRRLAAGGASALFADLHPTVRLAGGVLEIRKRHEQELRPDGLGLVLVPVGFTVPGTLVSCDPARPMLAYGPRGAASLWSPPARPVDDGFAALVGRGRSQVLLELARPRTTTELARALDVSAAAVSQRLSALRHMGLVEAHRLGRRVYYRRTARGDGLLRLYEPHAAADSLTA